jgi:hypothetical protein
MSKDPDGLQMYAIQGALMACARYDLQDVSQTKMDQKMDADKKEHRTARDTTPTQLAITHKNKQGI